MLQVKKRNGRLEDFQPEKINQVLEWACEGIEGVNASDVAMNAKIAIENKTKTSDIQEILIRSAYDLISLEAPNYQYVAGRLRVFALRKEVWGESEPPRLYDHLRKNKRLYDEDILSSYTESEIHKINKYLKHDRDYSFAHAGIQQMCDKYLIKDRSTGKIFETPQFAFVLIPMVLFKNYPDRLNLIKTVYDYLSTFKINLPTPILAGVRTKLKNYSSCILLQCDDTLDSIFTTSHIIGRYVADRSGIGLDMGSIRATGSPIRHGEVKHTGIRPFMKLMESAVNSTSQGGIRRGSCTTNVPFFHPQIEEIITYKNNKGADENKVRLLDYCIQISGLLYDRFVKGEDITLISSHEFPEVYQSFGLPEFDELYEKAEKSPSKFSKRIKASDLLNEIAKERLETGRIYIMHIDNANRHGNFKERVNASNLCVATETKLLIKGREIKQRGFFGLKNRSVKYETNEVSVEFLENQEVEVWNGKQWSRVTVVKTGVNQRLLNIHFNNGQLSADGESCVCGFRGNLRCTEYHKFYVGPNAVEKRAIELREGDKIFYTDHNNLKRSVYIEAVKDGGIDDTYCVNEPLEHKAVFNGILTGNCQEITHPLKPAQSLDDPNSQIGVCVLSAVNLLTVKEEELQNVCYTICLILHEVINTQEYRFIGAENFCKNYRSIGVGVSNYAAYLAHNKIRMDSPEAIQLTSDIFEKISYYLIAGSCQIAKDLGTKMPWFDKTKFADGILPIDTANTLPFLDKPKMDWNSLREDIKKYGLMNSTLMACMPVEASAICQNSTNGMDPIRSYLTTKKSGNGPLKLIPPSWPRYKNYYTTAFEMKDQLHHLRLYAAAQRWICMSMSANLYMDYKNYPDGIIPRSEIVKQMMYAHKVGVKNLYYLVTPDGSDDQTAEVSCPGGSCSL